MDRRFLEKDLESNLLKHTSEFLLEYTKEYNFPIVKCNDFGHKIINSTIPIGVNINIDCSNEKIEIVEQFLIFS